MNEKALFIVSFLLWIQNGISEGTPKVFDPGQVLDIQQKDWSIKLDNRPW